MTGSQQDFVAAAYGARAQDYVDSAVHAQGDDLDQIETILRDLPDARVLDLGCGGGHVSYRAAPLVRDVVACDITAAMLDAVAVNAAARGLGNIAVRRAGAESLPFEDASFDAVLSRFSAHHWADLDAGLRQARRVLAPGGLCVLIDTVAPPDRTLDTHLQAIELLRDASHVRDYGVAELVAAASRAGLALQGITLRRLRLEFATWTARTRTPALHADAIRALQRGSPDAVRAHFRIDPDGSFDLDAATLVLRAV